MPKLKILKNFYMSWNMCYWDKQILVTQKLKNGELMLSFNVWTATQHRQRYRGHQV